MIAMPEVRMTLEEYQQLLEAIEFGQRMKTTKQGTSPPTKKKRSGRTDPNMSKALELANKKARKKDGSYKKGYDQARLMREAHKIRRRME